jgi:PKD repeat protein
MRDYITKLNDRNLQRKKATGFTNYVLYSLIIIIAFKIIDLVGRINFQELETYEFTKLTWYSFCLSLALYFTYYSFVTSFNNTSTVRILKKSRKKETYFLSIIISGFFLSTIIPATIILWKDYNSKNLEYSIFEIILFILTAVNLLFLIVVLFSKNNDLYEAINKTDDNEILSKVFFIVSFFIIVSSIYLLSDINIIDKINLVLLCLLTFSIFAISEKIIDSHKEDVFSKDLENLEYEVYLKDISDNDIRDIFQKKYMGFLINDWIKYKESQISNEFEKYEKETADIELKEKEIFSVDKEQYPIEYQGRKNKFKELKDILESKKKMFFESNINEIDEVLKKDSSIKLEDFNKLKDLIIQLSSNKK